ncbi:putative secreted protein [Gottschalkia purinilytica]|uniref:Putative secreted protein n=1 Tax=Gottschalkia purinilytica TaxID=1503 RepID=A0A0L0WCV8_GOTPU|nr:phage tail tube protein [Gottschalkia purinilytica]KNF09302.1 putative secreted protein [Gottschalkia purinilytica]
MAEQMKVQVASYLGVKKIVRIADLNTAEILAIGGQRSSTVNKTADTIDVSTKTGGILNMKEIMTKLGVTDYKPKEYNDYKEYIQGQKEWSIETEGALPSSDTAFSILDKAYQDGEPVIVSELDLGRMKEKIGIAYVVDMSEEAPQEDLASYSLTLQGTGELVERDYVPTPPTGE